MRRVIGTSPVQVAFRNTERSLLTVEMIPSSIVPANTGLVYGKFGSAPVADPNSNTWDFVLNPGSTGGVNLYQSREKAIVSQDLWLTADTAGQVVNVIEVSVEQVEAAP